MKTTGILRPSSRNEVKNWLSVSALAIVVGVAGPARAAVMTSAVNGEWTSNSTWAGGTVPGSGDGATVRHAVALSSSASVSNVGVNASGALSLNNGASLNTAVNSIIGATNSGGTVTINSGAVWTNAARVLLGGSSTVPGGSQRKMVLDGGRYVGSGGVYSTLLLGDTGQANVNSSVVLTNGASWTQGGSITFKFGATGTSVATLDIYENCSFEAKNITTAISNSVSTHGVFVRGGDLILTEANEANALQNDAKIYFEGGTITFTGVDTLAAFTTFTNTWNSWVDGGRVDSTRYSKTQLKGFLDWDGSAAVAGDYAVKQCSPQDGAAGFMTHPQLRWYELEDADRYEIQIACDPAFETLQDSDSIPVPRYIPLEELPAGHDYWWRVRVILRGGRIGEWSTSRKITVNSPVNQYQIYTSDPLPVITDKIAQAASNTPARLVFETGTYRLALPDDAHLFNLSSKSNLIIDGGDSLVVMENNNSGFSTMTGCNDILLRNFKVDYMTADNIPTTHTAGTVVSVDVAGGSFVFQPLNGYLPPDDPRIRNAASRRWGCVMDPNTPGRLKNGSSNFYDFDTTRLDVLGNNQYRLYLLDSLKSRITTISPGDLFVKSAGWGQSLMYCTKSTNITYEQVVTYAGSRNHFIGHWNDSVSFLRCASRIKEGRFVSNGYGGYVGNGYTTGFWIEECLTEGMFDDGVNFANSSFFKITARDGANAARVAVFWDGITVPQPGDRVGIFTPSNCYYNGKFTIAAAEVIDYNNYWLTLDRDPGVLNPGTTRFSSSELRFDKKENPYTYVRNSTFRNSRRFGCLFKSIGGVVEGNVYSGLSHPAFRVGDIDSGMDSRNIRILNNTMIDCGFLTIGQNDSGGIYMENFGYTQTDIAQNIEISGNEIYDWNRQGVIVRNASGVWCESNTVGNLNSTSFIPYPGTYNYAIRLAYTDGCEVTANDLRDARPVDEAVRIENSTNCLVEDNLE